MTATQDLPHSPDRRRLLLGAGVGALAATVTAGAPALASAPSVTEAPESDKMAEKQSLYGVHQPGILNPRPAAGMVVAFDVLARDRAGLERLLRMLTERASLLMNGWEPHELDPKFPPVDSGILGPVVPTDNLTITVSFGASLFDERFGLKELKPKRLSRMVAFPNDALNADLCHGDLLVQFCANTPDTNIHALRDIMKNMPDLLMIRWKQEGSVPVQPPHSPRAKESARNFLGFRDGTGNPDSGNAETMNRIVWVQKGSDEPEWAAGGSYQAVRIIRNMVERWDRTPLQEQEAIIGRKKASGAPMTGKEEHDTPDFSADPEGHKTRLDSHIRLANARDAEAEKHIILRRPFNFSNGVNKAGQLEMGLLFICYQADLEQGFIHVQNKLNGEPLEEYLKPIGGGYFYALPGVADAADWYGRSLIEASLKQSAKG